MSWATPLRLARVATLVTAVFDVWGFCLGVVGIFILLCTTKPLVGKGYLYPLVPFNGKALFASCCSGSLSAGTIPDNAERSAFPPQFAKAGRGTDHICSPACD